VLTRRLNEKMPRHDGESRGENLKESLASVGMRNYTPLVERKSISGWLIARMQEEAALKRAAQLELQEAADSFVYRGRDLKREADEFLRKSGAGRLAPRKGALS
jgi:hypothetical protein